MSELIDKHKTWLMVEDIKNRNPDMKAILREVQRGIKTMPSIESESQWIPNTKETVPKDPLRKQIQLKNGWIITGWFDGEDWFPVPEVGAALLFDNVLAWCELPSPCQPESEAMQKVVDIEERRPHVVSEVICVKCGKRWVSVRPKKTLLKKLKCENCGRGYVIETGQILEIYEDKQNRIPYKDYGFIKGKEESV